MYAQSATLAEITSILDSGQLPEISSVEPFFELVGAPGPEEKVSGGNGVAAEHIAPDATEWTNERMRKLWNPTVGEDFRLTLVNCVSGRKISVGLQPDPSYIHSREVDVWVKGKSSKATAWFYDMGAVLREAAAKIGIDPDRATLWRGVYPLEPIYELHDIHLGTEHEFEQLKTEAGRLEAAQERLPRAYTWGGNVLRPADDSARRTPMAQAWEIFGIRVDSEGVVHERQLRFTPQIAELGLFERVSAAAQTQGKCIGIGWTSIATGEEGWGVYLCDPHGNALQALGADHKLYVALVHAALGLGIEQPPIEPAGMSL